MTESERVREIVSERVMGGDADQQDLALPHPCRERERVREWE